MGPLGMHYRKENPFLSHRERASGLGLGDRSMIGFQSRRSINRETLPQDLPFL